MKTIKFILVLIVSLINMAYAQEKEKQTISRGLKTLSLEISNIPPQLQERCIPVLTLMVISFDQSGKINSLSFSDSAYPQFIAEIQRIRDNIDFESLYKETKSLRKEDEQIIIPIQIDTGVLGECESGVLQFDLMNLYLFDKKPLKGKYFLYKKISSKILMGRAIS